MTQLHHVNKDTQKHTNVPELSDGLSLNSKLCTVLQENNNPVVFTYDQ